ncbi:MAG TPA: ribosome small subunit-dependent GTPase A [Candidatus Krumholzibacteria bacterium]
MQERLENGLVVRVTGGEVWVRVGTATVACSQRGRFRVKDRAIPVVAGDRVTVLRDTPDTASLEGALPRTSWLSRYVERGDTERVVVANVDRLFVVVAATDPPVRPGFLDRVLASAEYGHVKPCIVFNKMDLATPDQFEELRATYAPSLYELVATCAVTGKGIDRVARQLGNGVYAFVGESGVGKSSLLNRLDPDLDLVVDDVAEKTGRGRHTTTNAQLFPFREGFLADTPGMQMFSFPGTDENTVVGCFPDIAHIEPTCRYNPCTHSHEPGCAIKAAVEAGRIPASRYQSYLDILTGIRERAKNKQW